MIPFFSAQVTELHLIRHAPQVPPHDSSRVVFISFASYSSPAYELAEYVLKAGRPPPTPEFLAAMSPLGLTGTSPRSALGDGASGQSTSRDGGGDGGAGVVEPAETADGALLQREPSKLSRAASRTSHTVDAASTAPSTAAQQQRSQGGAISGTAAGGPDDGDAGTATPPSEGPQPPKSGSKERSKGKKAPLLKLGSKIINAKQPSEVRWLVPAVTNY